MLRALFVLLLCAMMGGCSSGPPSTSGGKQARGFFDVPDGGFPDSGAEPTPTGDTFDGPGGSCKLTRDYGNTECRACMNEKCCAPVKACEDDPECQAVHACVTDCTSYREDAHACAVACMPNGPPPLFVPVASCWQDKECWEPCGWRNL